jgi:hypothetical protein
MMLMLTLVPLVAAVLFALPSYGASQGSGRGYLHLAKPLALWVRAFNAGWQQMARFSRYLHLVHS